MMPTFSFFLSAARVRSTALSISPSVRGLLRLSQEASACRSMLRAFARASTMVGEVAGNRTRASQEEEGRTQRFPVRERRAALTVEGRDMGEQCTRVTEPALRISFRE